MSHASGGHAFCGGGCGRGRSRTAAPSQLRAIGLQKQSAFFVSIGSSSIAEAIQVERIALAPVRSLGRPPLEAIPAAFVGLAFKRKPVAIQPRASAVQALCSSFSEVAALRSQCEFFAAFGGPVGD